MIIFSLNKEHNPLLSAVKDGIFDAFFGKSSTNPVTTQPAPEALPEVDPSLVNQDIPSSID